MDYISLATAAALWYRVSPIPPAAHAFLATACAAFLANIAWRRRAPARWLRYREAPAALLRLGGFGFGAGWPLIRNFMEDISPAAGDGSASLAWQAALLLLGAATPSLLLLWVARPLRLSMALPIQLALVLDSTRYSAATCSAAGLALGTPRGGRLTRQLYQLLGTLRYHILPSGCHAGELPPQDQCQVLITYIQLGLAFALPALVQAALESAMFQRHQRQRQQLGLPPEKGWQAGLYRCVAEAVRILDWPVLMVFTWLMLGILFDLAVLLSVGPEAPVSLA